MTDRDAAFIVWGLPLLGTILIGLGWWMVSHSFIQSGIAVFVAASSSIMLAVFIYIRSIYQKQRQLRIAPIIFWGSLFCVAIGFAAASTYDNLPSNKVAFVATATNSAFFDYLQGRLGPLSPMVYVVNASGQRAASSINLLVYFTFQNISDKPKLMLGYDLEISPDIDGPWTPLCLVNITEAGKIYWINIIANRLDMDDAREFSSENFMDIKVTEKAIPVDNAISGWTAWEYPEFRRYRPTYGRLSMVLASGERFRQIIAINAEHGTTLSSARLRMPPPATQVSLRDVAQLLPCQRTYAVTPP